MVYTEITRRLFNEKLRMIEAERQPECVVGALTKPIKALAARYNKAVAEMKTCERRLKLVGLRVEDDGKLVVDYARERQRRTKWQDAQRRRLQTVHTLRAEAQIHLLDIEPKAAKDYLLKLRAKLAGI